MSAAETRNVTAFTAYGTELPQKVSMSPPATGPIIQARFSIVCMSEFAFGSSSSGTRFGRPALAAGMKNPVAMPATAARATIAAGLSTNGSAAKTPKRDEVGGDHQPASRQPVDERAEQEPDDDDREEVGDQERSDPDARFRAGP